MMRKLTIGILLFCAVLCVEGSVSTAFAQNPPDPLITITPYNPTPTPIRQPPDPLITITPYGTPTPTPAPVTTQPPSTGGGNAFPTIISPVKARTVPQLISTVIRILFGLIAMAAILVIIVSGFRMVISGSNPAERTKAKNAITWAVIGLLVALMSFSIVSILQKLIQT